MIFQYCTQAMRHNKAGHSKSASKSSKSQMKLIDSGTVKSKLKIYKQVINKLSYFASCVRNKGPDIAC